MVRDSGIGIPASEHKNIFEAFAQVDGSATRRYCGTGLGLAICSRLLTLMEGRIWVESECGRGSQFHFVVPCPAATTAPGQLALVEFAIARELSALIVDDNETNRIIVRDNLRRWEMVPDVAASAEEALGLIREHVDVGRPYDLLLIDARMPDLDGFALAKIIKNTPNLSGPRILMLSSMDLKGTEQQLTGLVDGYLQKPISRSALWHAIGAYSVQFPKCVLRPCCR